MSDISRNEICLDVELEGAIPMSVPPADAYILYVERAENAAASAESSATAAATSASAAKTSETNAANSAKGAESSATAAAASASAAKTSETNAANSAKGAESSATAAAASASAAKTSETNAANSAKGAESSATAAAASASAAKTSETNAANSAKGAESSATAAAASASAAKTSETNAVNSAKGAESSANKAKDIADNLEGLDGIAGIATTEEAVAGESDDKIMTPSKVKKAIEAQVPIKEIVNSIYPVGQIVEYASDINPNDLYSWQTWKQIKDVFTLAAGDKYTIGDTGGAATVTLTIDEIPAHWHTATASNDGEHIHSGVAKRNVNWQAGSDWTSDSGNLVASEGNTDNAGGHSHKIEIQNTGGGAAHNNMPPYLVTIKWKRTS